ncbi:LIM domain-containing protein PLIM2b-like [Zingiber officinale]|nr:LIM domain-containing protein PLIM2b-like [Zingiber officinale]XP_042437331.1 LIM domain-containing protein PLIM2b-like [Zingiber officinale]KAG6480426.1 hypothetical protein ZIOFF_063926 [Zingiber officinale]
MAVTFSGTQDKCKACEKTVHFVDFLSTDGVIYHKSCFRCSHCNGTLSMCNYSSMDGILYCKPHFEQLFMETGTFTKKFPTVTRSGERIPSKYSSMFSGTQDKCATCKKIAYPLEKLMMEGENYHKTCFKCSVGGCILTPASYAALNGILYCKHHFARLFMEKGTYSHVIQAAMLKQAAAVEHAVGQLPAL